MFLGVKVSERHADPPRWGCLLSEKGPSSTGAETSPRRPAASGRLHGPPACPSTRLITNPRPGSELALLWTRGNTGDPRGCGSPDGLPAPRPGRGGSGRRPFLLCPQARCPLSSERPGGPGVSTGPLGTDLSADGPARVAPFGEPRRGWKLGGVRAGGKPREAVHGDRGRGRRNSPWNVGI